jgi:hypothetical protein
MHRHLAVLALLLTSAAHAEEPVVPDNVHRFIVTSEPLGESDDRTASRLELVVREAEALLTPCRMDALERGEVPERFVQLEVRLKPSDGGVKKAKVLVSTGIEAVDTCVIEKVSTLRLTDPPKFPDRLELNINWATPKKETAAED